LQELNTNSDIFGILLGKKGPYLIRRPDREDDQSHEASDVADGDRYDYSNQHSYGLKGMHATPNDDWAKS